MRKIFIVLSILFALCGSPALGSANVEAGGVVGTPTALPMAPTNITSGDVTVCWNNGYAEMKIDGKLVRIPATGFTYAPEGRVQMSRENFAAQVDVVVVKFVSTGVGDSLDMLVEYTSFLPDGKLIDGKNYVMGRFKMGEGNCLWLSPIKK